MVLQERKRGFLPESVGKMFRACRCTPDDANATSRLNYLIDELFKVQQAIGQDGYLSAFPDEHFDRVEDLQGVWAPYYVVSAANGNYDEHLLCNSSGTFANMGNLYSVAMFFSHKQIHKIMAGLLDAHILCGNKRALHMVEAMAQYHLRRVDAVVATHGQDHWQRVLDNEFGGMNDIMYRMYARTGNKEHLRLARAFDKNNWFEPLSAGKDVLGGRHANTHLAQRAEATGDEVAATAVKLFFDMVAGSHAYATGGSNDKEFWFEPGVLGESVTNHEDAIETHETCTQFNILKVRMELRHLVGLGAPGYELVGHRRRVRVAGAPRPVRHTRDMSGQHCDRFGLPHPSNDSSRQSHALAGPWLVLCLRCGPDCISARLGLCVDRLQGRSSGGLATYGWQTFTNGLS
eukprot:365048-Chlamydomonas_euryale.AAC.19